MSDAEMAERTSECWDGTVGCADEVIFASQADGVSLGPTAVTIAPERTAILRSKRRE